jgi:hypothetical protein
MSLALAFLLIFWLSSRVKTNVNCGPTFRFVSNTKSISVGFYNQISKKTVREHCNENGLLSTFFFPTVTRKLRHVAGDKSLEKPYQKPQRLINWFLDLFSNVDDWILNLFSSTCIVILILLFVFWLLLIVLWLDIWLMIC